MTLLRVEQIDVHYGDFQALFGVSLSVEEGETLAVIGANGAGKSTLLKTVAGLLHPTRGEVVFDGRAIGRLPAYRRVRLGVALAPEGRRLFPSLTVEENLQMGAVRARNGPWDLAAVYELFPHLADLRRRLAATLSGGEQQAVAIGRALMANPRLLLLDEVSLGLAPMIVRDLYAALPRVTARGTTALVVEQDVQRALRVADRVQCLLEGRTVLEELAGSVSREQVAAAYFGI
ncbi:MAG TPA: ABC transporter ATP-binding protein [Jiangellaceae bacterium]|nr:ABC transporter ATP-binding protein [Jiangellaceae bacterium]